MKSGSVLVPDRVALPAAEGLSRSGVVDELRRASVESRRWDARRAELIRVAERLGLPREAGFPSTTEWLAAITGEPIPVCRSQVAIAQVLEDMPATRAAFASGELSEIRVKALAQAQALAPEPFAEGEAALLAQVAAAPARQVPQVLASWKRSAGLQAAEGAAVRPHQLRALHVSTEWSGLVHLRGNLDPEGGLIVLQALRALSEGAALDPQDTRTPAQARADALVEICRRHLQADPTSRRRPPSVLVTIPWSALEQGTGLVDTPAGPITAATARRLACDATVSRVLLDPESVPIETGRATRVVPDHLRRVLELRDGGCTYPGCQVPARWCDAHHLVHWAEGGQTVPANLQLLCSRHHTQAHQAEWHPRRE